MNKTELIQRNFLLAANGVEEEWLTTDYDKWYEYIINLPENLKITYLVVIFHNQVFNGGFHQYFSNGYGIFASETIECLNKLNAKYQGELLSYALYIVNCEGDSDNVFRKKLFNKQVECLFEDDEVENVLEDLDDKYYERIDDIEILLGDFLLK